MKLNHESRSILKNWLKSRKAINECIPDYQKVKSKKISNALRNVTGADKSFRKLVFNNVCQDNKDLKEIFSNFFQFKPFKEEDLVRLSTKVGLSERKTYLFKKYSDKYINLYNSLYNEKFISTTEKYINLNKKRDLRHFQINDFPIEYRKYDKNSIGMDWHKDLALFDGEPYYECVLTVSNNSESYFEYINREGYKEKIYTKPNMLICVMPNIVPHYVSPTKSGEREILKFIATFDNNEPNENYLNEIKGDKYF